MDENKLELSVTAQGDVVVIAVDGLTVLSCNYVMALEMASMIATIHLERMLQARNVRKVELN